MGPGPAARLPALGRSLGLCLALALCSRGHRDPQAAGHALFTETPHDVTALAGEDVEMSCSFRGSSSPSYALEIQWWYVRNHGDWADKRAWAADRQLRASQHEETGKEANKISVVKVSGGNISHKLRLSRVKGSDEGTYECRVIDFSASPARPHKVKAYLRVRTPGPGDPPPASHLQDTRPPGGGGPRRRPPPEPAEEPERRSVDGADGACSP
ncbi:V-set and transmembrane domain-containing protein 2-like protein [Ornithorhynchus anatinus]|uniref:V-set and transmembrane domain-containing protein 2-like protein n=1 Tax=Ornithorhynchus anatinus TaxID=9258 RepID=UPI0010A86305|nr:V-set and transmembrane domain-containing protein 2-like protein [Ornithorhynchus anatinus]